MRTPTVAVLDYGAGNLRSVQRAMERAGAVVTVTGDPATARVADALLVPGVGHFGQCVNQFREAGLERLVRDWVDAQRPLLGVCVGMQILYAGSDEDPDAPGLGLLPGRVRRLPPEVTVPHMGWNDVEAVTGDPLVYGVDGQQAYFVHSYAAVPDSAEHVVAITDYGPGFPSVVRVGSVVGTQFHPEKSADVGARLLKNWLREVGSTAGGRGGRVPGTATIGKRSLSSAGRGGA